VIWGVVKQASALRTGQSCATRPSSHMRALVSPSRGRTRTDSVLARARQRPDDRTVSGLGFSKVMDSLKVLRAMCCCSAYHS
jgi:hypothetical protein